MNSLNLTKEPKSTTVEDVPGELLVESSWKAWGLQVLYWDYVDSICDICTRQKRAEFKRDVRTLRELKRGFEHFRCYTVPQWLKEDEDDRAFVFEDNVRKDLEKHRYALDMVIAKRTSSDDDRELLVAYGEALALQYALITYAGEMNQEIAKYWEDVPPLSLLFEETLTSISVVRRLHPAGLLSDKDLDCVRFTGSVLAKRLKGADYLKVPKPDDKFPEN